MCQLSYHGKKVPQIQTDSVDRIFMTVENYTLQHKLIKNAVIRENYFPI